MKEDFDPHTFFEHILMPLLCPEDGTHLQVIYVKMQDGSKHPMIGAPMSKKDWDQIDELEQGEIVQIDLHDGEDYSEDWQEPNTPCLQ